MYNYDDNARYAQDQVKHLIGGFFEYFAGGIVRLDCIATDWETKEIMVVYTEQKADEDGSYKNTYIRPFNLFFGYVEDKDGNRKSRFNYLGKSDIQKITR